MVATGLKTVRHLAQGRVGSTACFGSENYQRQADRPHHRKPAKRVVIAPGDVEEPARHDGTDGGAEGAEEHDSPEDRAVGAGAEEFGHGG